VKKNSRPTFDSPTDDPARVESEARRVALGLLARREHSSLELAYKLSARGFDADLVASLLHRLSAEGLLSDARFAESFVRARRDKGYGPVRIRGELRERGVDSETIEACLDQSDVAWLRLVASVRAKRVYRRTDSRGAGGYRAIDCRACTAPGAERVICVPALPAAYWPGSAR
jgi:regulatory protein